MTFHCPDSILPGSAHLARALPPGAVVTDDPIAPPAWADAENKRPARSTDGVMTEDPIRKMADLPLKILHRHFLILTLAGQTTEAGGPSRKRLVEETAPISLNHNCISHVI